MSLTANNEVQSRGHKEARALKAAAAVLYKGHIAVFNASGYAEEGTDAAAKIFAGIVKEKVDNSAGAAGDLYVDVFTTGCFLLAATSIDQADVGKLAYISDAETVTDGGTASNDIPVGIIVEYVSATSCWVEIGLPGIAGTAST